MNIIEIPMPTERFESVDISNLSIKAYGKDNLYPQRLLQVIANSSTGALCTRRMARFIEGRGFKDTALYGYVVNHARQTADDILKLIVTDFAKLGGFALHVNYNALRQIVEVHHVPFENCRLGVDDSTGYISKVALHPDWSAKSKRGGKQLKVSKEAIDYIDIFNPHPAVVAAQMQSAGSIEQYKGQILYYSGDGELTYATPRCDEVITEMSTEEGLGNVNFRNVRNNFFPAGMFIKEKDSKENSTEDDDFITGLAKFQGDKQSSKMFAVIVDNIDQAPKFVEFPAANFDAAFTNTENRTVERIYAAFEQEKFFRTRSGSLGFSSDISRDVNNDYSDILISERQAVERVFTQIFRYWKEYVSDNFSITPIYQEISKEDANPNNA